MVTYLLGTKSVDRSLEELVLEKTDGVPFFIEELIRSLRDFKAIEKRDHTYFLSENFKSAAIPSSIQDMIMARVDSLPEAAKKALQIGSVIGREFSHELLKEIIGLPEPELLAQLAILKDSELIYERGIYPESNYIYKHALTQEAVYHSLIKSTRQKYHKAVAETLEKEFVHVIKSEPELLGYHFNEAGLAEPAIFYWQQAGEVATRRSANIEAIAHLTNGLELLNTLPETNERMKMELNLLIAIGSPQTATKGQASKEIERTLSRARELCEQIGEPQHYFTVLYGLLGYYGPRADYQNHGKIAEELWLMAESMQDQFYFIAANRAMGTSYFWKGSFSNAKSHFWQVIDLYNPQQHQSLAFVHWIDVKLHSLSYLMPILWLLGYPEQAIKKIHETRDFGNELSHSYSWAMALLFVVWLHCHRRDLNKTQELAEELIEISDRQRFPLLLEIGRCFFYWSLGMQGKENNVVSKMCQAMDDLQGIRYEQLRTLFLALLSELYVKEGQIDKAINVIEEARDLIEKTGEHFWEAEIIRLKGELLLGTSAGNIREAEQYFHNSIKVSRHQQAKSLELRTAMSLSRLWQSQGKKEEARRLLSEIYGWFTEGFDTADLKDAKALLEQLS
jgi:predicted ATPase